MIYLKRKTFAALLSIALLTGLAACSDDDKKIEIETPQSPKLELGIESLKVKNGADQTVEIKQGGGDYNVFSLDPDVATAELSGEQLQIHGVADGMTAIIISDNGGYYKKVPVSVYTYDGLTFDTSELEITALLGKVAMGTANVTQGNGGYFITSSDARVTAMIADNGEIAVSATTKPDDYEATLTVTDKSGFTATLTVRVKASLEPFTEEDLAELKASDTRTYTLDGSQSTYMNYGTSLNAVGEDGTIVYGWEYAPISWLKYSYKLSFKGENTVGKKSDARLVYSMYGGTSYDEPVDLEIIQINDTHVWGVFTFVKDDVLHYGYFCDTI
jgi:hypothetical protein